MRQKIAILGSLACGVLITAGGTGCTSAVNADRREQLERVARDWTTTIRASQVVPVYPLTQDFQPGDVFLVQQSVKAQEAAFDDKGFIPIDMQIARLVPTGYSDFYRSYVLHADESPDRLPGGWHSWDAMPQAGFPTYSFAVSGQAGFSLALPVQAVPVGLSLLGASEAHGSVTISDAFTYGVDVATLLEQVRESDSIRSFIEQIHFPEGETYYLRVVNRVFATRKMVVTLTSDSSTSGGLDVGVPKPVGTTGAQTSSLDQINAINESLETMNGALPGGSVRAVSAQNRTITFNETFAEPIVFGYHGFDMAILSDGSMGPVVPTFSVLDSGMLPPVTGISQDDVSYLAVLGLLRSIESQSTSAVAGIFAEAAQYDATLNGLYTSLVQSGRKPSAAWVASVTQYKNGAKTPEAGRSRLRKAQRWLSAAAKSVRVELSGGGE